eukprot:TRINITY_DN11603_c0_g1_i1.p1 TRINITY_DN11603_c0_g1~~TRINITY_DN11603_c0_g1_i1.p1  ORF type:complete len:400 (-),score=60.27 TRINITY_DN11603_c0_g1_i1:31-1230(-)
MMSDISTPCSVASADPLKRACVQCRQWKVKCTGSFPCDRCSRLGHSCEQQERKRKRVKPLEELSLMQSRGQGFGFDPMAHLLPEPRSLLQSDVEMFWLPSTASVWSDTVHMIYRTMMQTSTFGTGLAGIGRPAGSSADKLVVFARRDLPSPEASMLFAMKRLVEVVPANHDHVLKWQLLIQKILKFFQAPAEFVCHQDSRGIFGFNCMECVATFADVYCAADNAHLCAQCDEELHSGRVLSKHVREPILHIPLAACEKPAFATIASIVDGLPFASACVCREPETEMMFAHANQALGDLLGYTPQAIEQQLFARRMQWWMQHVAFEDLKVAISKFGTSDLNQAGEQQLKLFARLFNKFNEAIPCQVSVKFKLDSNGIIPEWGLFVLQRVDVAPVNGCKPM